MENKYIISENDSEYVKELKRQIISLNSQLEIQNHRLSHASGGNLLQSKSIDLYPGEQHDFVLSILKQVREKCPEGSRPRDIINSLLAENKPIGRAQEILDELNRIFKKGDPSTEKDISDLEALGFKYTPSRKHPKLRFHDKYMFVLSATPSDKQRGSLNKLKEINKCIAISQKV